MTPVGETARTPFPAAGQPRRAAHGPCFPPGAGGWPRYMRNRCCPVASRWRGWSRARRSVLQRGPSVRSSAHTPPPGTPPSSMNEIELRSTREEGFAAGAATADRAAFSNRIPGGPVPPRRQVACATNPCQSAVSCRRKGRLVDEAGLVARRNWQRRKTNKKKKSAPPRSPPPGALLSHQLDALPGRRSQSEPLTLSYCASVPSVLAHIAQGGADSPPWVSHVCAPLRVGKEPF